MFHWRAKQLLTRSFDEELPEPLAAALDVHVASCARCRRIRREHAVCESLLAELPARFSPLEFDPTSYARLMALTRWSEAGEPPEPRRHTPPILALAMATTIVLLAATLRLWSPVVTPAIDPVSFASYQTHSAVAAASWHTGRF